MDGGEIFALNPPTSQPVVPVATGMFKLPTTTSVHEYKYKFLLRVGRKMIIGAHQFISYLDKGPPLPPVALATLAPDYFLSALGSLA